MFSLTELFFSCAHTYTIMKFDLTLALSSHSHSLFQLQGQRLKEAVNINKSLSALGNVIKALTENQPHVPYRDSKLTFMLKNALGGNSRCCLIACISPAARNIDESLSTLKFAERAKRLQNHAEINVTNQVLDSSAMLEELERLRTQVSQLQETVVHDGSLKNKERVERLERIISQTMEDTNNEKKDYESQISSLVQEKKKLEEAGASVELK